MRIVMFLCMPKLTAWRSAADDWAPKFSSSSTSGLAAMALVR